MEPPTEPKKEDCCDSGCNPCIFDVYEKRLHLYKKFLKSGESEKNNENGISDLEYTTFVLVSKAVICNDHIILAFKSRNPEIKVWWSPGAHFLIKYNHNGTACSRAYTPIQVNDVVDTDYDFMVIVKRYETGLVSRYLYALDIGENTVWRGPYSTYKIAPNKYTRTVMVAQGTGIAPFFSIISAILEDENDMTKIILFYCCRSDSTILFRNELHLFKLYWNFSYKLYVTEAVETTSLKYQEPVIHHKLSYEDFDYLKPLTCNDQFLLCGSKQFTQHFENFLLGIGVHSENMILF